MRLTGIQIAAAITLSKLSREALAKEAGIGRNTLDRIINESVVYRDDTISKITRILEARGIEFLPGEGVRKKEKTITTLNGENCWRELLLDVYNTLHEKGGELLIAHLDERLGLKYVGEEFLYDQIKKRKQSNITHRLLVCEDDSSLIPPYDTYRAIPKEYFSQHPFYIYGPKLALVSWEPEPRVIIIDDERFAESAKKLFDIAWNVGKEIQR